MVPWLTITNVAGVLRYWVVIECSTGGLLAMKKFTKKLSLASKSEAVNPQFAL